MAEESSAADESSAGGEYVVVARRYRPQAFAELIGQEHIARALEQAIQSGRVGHAYLFTGARGVGKTSAARILAKALNCPDGPSPTPCNACDVCHCIATGDDVDVLEIDGASNRGIDEIRQLRQNAGVRPTRSRFKVYIIDEVHMLTKEAFNALLKTLEEPPEHVKFIFATTEPNKIPITILSRCQRFDFAGIESQSIQARLAQIAQAEGVEIDEEALRVIAARAAGSMRDSQSLLEQLLSSADAKITADEVNQMLGVASAARVGEIAEHIAARDAAAALALVDDAVRTGVDGGQLIDQLMAYFRDLMALAVGCPQERLLAVPPAQCEAAGALAESLGVNTLLAVLQVFDQTAARMRVSVHERTLLDMAIVRAASLEDLEELSTLVAQIPEQAAPPTPRPRPTQPAQSPAKAPPAIPPTTAPEPPRQNHSQSEPPQASAPAPSEGSLLEQFTKMQENGVAPTSAPAPKSRRQQQADVAQQPFVRKAMELFDAEPGKLRYTPPSES